MKSLPFTKMEGSGNDFVILDGDAFSSIVHRPSSIVKMCDRKFGIGADGILLLEKSKKSDVRMRIFNADGSEAEMCGNGARCVALYIAIQNKKKSLTIETLAGFLQACVFQNSVKLKMTDPLDLKLGQIVKVGAQSYEVDYINTGVPHAVVEVSDLKNFQVKSLGHALRHHRIFQPAGSNVNFMKFVDKDHLRIRTYERGVEDETLACGTGAVASAIIAILNHVAKKLKNTNSASVHQMHVTTQSRE